MAQFRYPFLAREGAFHLILATIAGVAANLVVGYGFNNCLDRSAVRLSVFQGSKKKYH